MMKLTELQVWQELATHRSLFEGQKLSAFFEKDGTRAAHYTFRVGGLELDLSRNHLTEKTLELLLSLAEERGVEMTRDAMFAGKKINTSEDRAVLHTALRSAETSPLLVDGQDVRELTHSVDQKMEVFVGAVREGRWLGATGKPIKTIVNIGIGGSDLGPRLAVHALAQKGQGPAVRFVANVDPFEIESALDGLDPETTLFVVVSKTFTTLETLTNARSAREWLVSALGEEAVPRHFVAVSVSEKAVKAFGIDTANMFPMFDWVGGRLSLWSAVGLSIALAIGWKGFLEMREGAALMDRHFLSAPLSRNMPVLLALVGLWYRNFWGAQAHAILPYAERLRDLPRYFQQLDMESNGKRVRLDGTPVAVSTGPIIFGECGTVGQHSFHQWLHQGTDVIPVDFIGVRTDPCGKPDHHQALLANLVAQAEALLHGRETGDAARDNPGDRPSTLLWLNQLDPKTFGEMIALYEHKVFVQGVIWGINSFDQWGVELGKQLANAEMEKGHSASGIQHLGAAG